MKQHKMNAEECHSIKHSSIHPHFVKDKAGLSWELSA